YERFDADHGVSNFKLDAYDALDQIREKTERYLDKQETKDLLQDVGRAIATDYLNFHPTLAQNVQPTDLATNQDCQLEVSNPTLALSSPSSGSSSRSEYPKSNSQVLLPNHESLLNGEQTHLSRPPPSTLHVPDEQKHSPHEEVSLLGNRYTISLKRMTEIQANKVLEVSRQQRRTHEGESFQRFQKEHLVHDRGLRKRKNRNTAAENPDFVHTDTSSALFGKEINRRGPATFPFGETLFLRAAMSRQIQQDMSEKDPATRQPWWSGYEKWDLPDVGLGDKGRGDMREGEEEWEAT
ncbi:MAG: hypothetical protein Q9214_006719, partial [Letrouitia sp. 1 TL-2023]